jgi:hypothetical protein
MPGLLTASSPEYADQPLGCMRACAVSIEAFFSISLLLQFATYLTLLLLISAIVDRFALPAFWRVNCLLCMVSVSV